MSYTPLSKRKRSTFASNKVLIACAIIVAYFLYGQIQYSSAVDHGYQPADSKKKIILIQKGDSAKDVGATLETKSIVKNGSYVSKFLSKENLSDKILAGRFELSPAMSIREIAGIITDAKQAKNFITIPEGFTVKQIDDRLTSEQLITSGDFLDAVKKFSDYTAYPWLPKAQITATSIPLEGFLFPDTYKIDPAHFSSQDLIDLMLSNFQKKLPPDITAELTAKNISLFDLVTVASMVEKEVRHSEDLGIVAGIIWKRANAGWLLNIDATILYGTGKKSLTSADLHEDSPYNTYTRKGLPLGPISNPGIKAIQAALNPTKTSYWFYLTDPKTGKAVYASSNDGQNRNRAIYLK